MKSLYEYSKDNLILEYRPKGSKNKKKKGEEPAISDDFVVDTGKLVDPDKKDPEKRKGKDAEEQNKTWGFEEPTNDDLMEDIDLDELENNRNYRLLFAKMKSDEPFFILGKAGWGKTSLIKQIAKKCGKCIITVYLDKALATDLDGIPVPMNDGRGRVDQVVAMPAWAAIMKDNPDKDFLLFFDEMNQAAPDVQNALMPIVLETTISGYKFNNFMVGAAGNFASENDAVSELSGPLKSRFKPIIEWETNSSSSWRSAFKYLHKQWDAIIGKSLIDELERNADIFANPREIENLIFKHFNKIKNENPPKLRPYLTKPSDIVGRLNQMLNDDSKDSKSTDNIVNKLADSIYDWYLGKEQEAPVGRSSKTKKTTDMIPQDVLDVITSWVKDDYIRAPFTNGPNDKGLTATLKDYTNPDFVEEHKDDIDLDSIGINFEQWCKIITKVWNQYKK